MSEAAAEALTIDVGGRPHMRNAAGHLVALELVKDQDRIEDLAVRTLFEKAILVRKALHEFREAAFGDIDDVLQLLDEQYGAAPGGAKGNVTLFSFDGLMRVQVQVQDQIQFGPELQSAKALMDECVADWSVGANAELCALVQNAFRVDKEGQINRGALLSLQKVEWKDPRAIRAMEAIKDSIRPVGSKRYVRFASRSNTKASWEGVPLDMANA